MNKQTNKRNYILNRQISPLYHKYHGYIYIICATFGDASRVSVVIWGEAWRCGGQLDAVENVQMRAARIFLGVGRRHPLISLQFEMDMLPVKWEALRRGIEFWVQVMRMNDNRLVKVVMLEALEVGSKVKWVKDLQQSLKKLGWRGLNVVALDGLTIKEVKQLLKHTAWRRLKAA